jgi:iron-siderophore transport system permease protein
VSGAATPVRAAPPALHVRHVRLRARRRIVAMTALLGGVATGLFVLTLVVGSTYVPPLDVLESVLGLSADPGVDFVVRDLRLPIAAAALCVGLALGIAGTLFQRLLGNPLAAPELVGVSAGASLAAVAGIVLFAWSGYAISLAALLGALTGAALIYALAWRDGISGYRLILIGIGMSELMLALVTYLIARADIHEAREAMHWLVGSIGQSGGSELRALAIALVVLVPLAAALIRSLRALELGDEPARALGVRVETARLALIGIAVALVGFATAVAGPIAFVALVAGPVAQRLLDTMEGGLLAAAFVGAGLVLASDLVAQHVVPVALPTGVLTGAIGAPYLLWLLATLNRQEGG